MDDQRVRTYVGGRNFAARYAAHKGCNRFMYELRRVGMRYITLFVNAKQFTLNYAGVRPVKYPLDMSPSFHTADALHSRIYDVCREHALGVPARALRGLPVARTGALRHGFAQPDAVRLLRVRRI